MRRYENGALSSVKLTPTVYVRSLLDPAAGGTLTKCFLRINGRFHYLCRAMDQDGDVLDILVRAGRDKKAAKKVFPKLFKGLWFVPLVIRGER